MRIFDYAKLKQKYNSLLNDYEVLKEDFEKYRTRSKKVIKHLRIERRLLKKRNDTGRND